VPMVVPEEAEDEPHHKAQRGTPPDSRTTVHLLWDPEDFFCRAHRARAALRALSLRCSAVSFASRAFPPLRPMEVRN
jgi:hypothetical protein